ncbi:organic hydroperoxide resistance protein [Fluoribacter dumoffii]|uniref:General stress protein 17o n=1 Tax=Fluoribacter dumoffii TaxID=463 RepID=A0A377GCA5_9GAMM|nr:organic hydroperoxide resistance protein [Fluoribacter dumoffii]KTC90762.1 organic hydroperoxide resistance protein [Fluoribacter dumoffii NY 23]MCW8386443.1 organic hydroperoxide resistance protein [Fluoribacter dumoffii]MCW8419496.1 organic hydroperoxide resistance protein [Fluoribacter dumoffii]MCW8452629.1 organic hydroperoxide resistance protein [Fluoribacter dumoffii]MCW8460120.1 organic hydroperoxide resistance protein [Fluoribacter dumoffii]
MKALYTATARTHGGREGHVETSDGLLRLDLAKPKELGGQGDGTNPEELFAAGYAACFESAMRHIARLQNIHMDNASILSQVSLYPTPEQGFKLGVEMHVNVRGLNQKDAEALVAKAHEVCPYSNAIRGNVEVEFKISAE